jgi:hypothetical protein
MSTAVEPAGGEQEVSAAVREAAAAVAAARTAPPGRWPEGRDTSFQEAVVEAVVRWTRRNGGLPVDAKGSQWHG